MVVRACSGRGSHSAFGQRRCLALDNQEPGIGYGTDYAITYPARSPNGGYSNKWRYLLHIAYEPTNGGRKVLKNLKHVWMEVQDRDHHVLLHDEAFFDCASIEVTATRWQVFSKLHVKLFEEGNEFTAREDPYNAALVKSGPRLLLDRAYKFNAKSHTFERVK